jgi:hypothetical protein
VHVFKNIDHRLALSLLVMLEVIFAIFFWIRAPLRSSIKTSMLLVDGPRFSIMVESGEALAANQAPRYDASRATPPMCKDPLQFAHKSSRFFLLFFGMFFYILYWPRFDMVRILSHEHVIVLLVGYV